MPTPDAATAARLASGSGPGPAGSGAHFLAGGTNLLDLMKLDVLRPRLVIGIGALGSEHGRIEANRIELRLGALVRMSAAAGDFEVALAAFGAEVDLLDGQNRSRRPAFEAIHRLSGDTPHLEAVLQPGEPITGFRVPRGG